jgi:hypothetical protein
MSEILNNWEFASQLDQFKDKVLDPQVKKVDEAWKIMSDIHYPWKDDKQKNRGQAQLDNYKAWLDFYQKFHEAGTKLVSQHEAFTNSLSKWYDRWYDNISNNGKQETEMMEMQADMLNEIFVEIYKALKPLNLDIKPPNGLNL